VGEPLKLLREAMRLARRGGVVAFQESDIDSLKCFPPHPAWDALRDALGAALAASGGDARFGQRLYRIMRGEGMKEVQYRPFIVGVRSGDAMTDFLPATAESMRRAVLEHRIMSAAQLDAASTECRAHLAERDVVFNLYTTVQVWGLVP
jgi:hypothetical protein